MALKELLLAASASIKTGKGGATPEEISAKVHEVVDPIHQELLDQIAAINAKEADDTTKLAEINDAITSFATDVVKPADAGTGTGTGDTGAGTGTGSDTGGAAA